MTPWHHGELQKLISKLYQGQVSGREIQCFYQYCYAIAISYLRVKKHRGKLYFKIESDLNKDLEDLASDCIIPLFEQDNPRSFIRFQSFFKSRFPVLRDTPETELFLALKGLIISCVEQELVRYFKHIDAEGFRLYRNITLASERNKKLNERRWGDETYLYLFHPGWVFPSDYVKKRAMIYFDDLVQIFHKNIRFHQDFPRYLQEILVDIERKEIYAMMVEKSLIHQAFRKVLSLNVRTEITDNVLIAEDDSMQERGDTLMQHLMELLKEAIEDTYYRKGKIDDSMKTNYQIIMKHYFSDLIQDGHTDALPEYWNTYIPGVNTFPDHKSRLEYLVRLGREKVRELYKKI
jgi:hypothetical protein